MGAGEADPDLVAGVHLAAPSDTVGYWVGFSHRDYAGVLPFNQLGDRPMGGKEMMDFWPVVLLVLIVAGAWAVRRLGGDLSYKDSCPSDDAFLADAPDPKG
jgi:hypothetical protein